MSKESTKNAFSELISRYDVFISSANRKDVSEETIRTWINEMLSIFGWSVQNTNEVKQEKILPETHRRRLKGINSAHSRPDYTLLNGRVIKTFIDAKDISKSIMNDKEVAFQIRSYGWSSETPCAYVTNFEEFAIYDCRFLPYPDQEANLGVLYFKLEEYIDNFDLLYDHLNKQNVISGKLEDIYNTTPVEGQYRLDDNFTSLLSKFRCKLAKNILTNNPDFIVEDSIKLNYFVQVIMDRIIFIRVCESRGIEEEGRIRQFQQNHFWNRFRDCCYMDFHEHYDGAMFGRDEEFNRLTIDDHVFDDFIDSLYYPSPYKFDVIPVKVIAGIYELFLAKQLIISGENVIESLKSEYIRTQGAISTPKHIVKCICESTFSFDEMNSISSLLEIKVLDPACGSGTFLIECFELLENQSILLFNSVNVEEEYLNWFVVGTDSVFLTVDAKRALMTQCIHGIDCDETAIEVTKMSLALKIIDNNDLLVLQEIGIFGEKILREIHQNIKLGNTLVKPDIELDRNEFRKINPFDIENNGFKAIFEQHGGFDYIVGNPPYVETKHYKKYSPLMHAYLSTNYYSFEGKADLAVLFIERCIQLLNLNGRLGFIVQKRFFKTEYGAKIRDLIAYNKYLFRVIDFQTTDLFPRRSTYVAIIVLDMRKSDFVSYECVAQDPREIQTSLENHSLFNNTLTVQIPSVLVTELPWSFESFHLLGLIQRLRSTHGTFHQFPGLHIKDGIQALWKKAYHFTDYSICGDVFKGKNGWGEVVELEVGIVKGVIYNSQFYCFKDIEPSAYSIFPYEGDKLRTRIPLSEIHKRYPLAYKYLISKEVIIKETVKYIDDPEFWHIFTREHNHDTYYNEKIIMPMTAYDTIATYVDSRGIFMDNSNVWFIKINSSSTLMLKAITSVINSTTFSALARAEANPQRGGYFKFNKQYLVNVPFPSKSLLTNNSVVESLAKLHDDINELQNCYLSETSNRKELYRSELDRRWMILDNLVYEIYALNSVDRAYIESLGRTISRVELLS